MTSNEMVEYVVASPKDVARFWRLVEKGDGCWLWTGAKLKGYGGFKFMRKSLLATRISYRLKSGEPLTALSVCHTCDTPACVRPDHLFAATHSENMKDSYRKGRTKMPDPRAAMHTYWDRVRAARRLRNV